MLTSMGELAEIIRAAMAPIPRSQRARFLELVDDKLRGHELGAGIVSRACSEVQKTFLVAPVDVVEPPPPSKQPARSPWRRRA
jgi:hypothetical protein